MLVRSRIMDINKYAEMVSGVDFCETYSDATKDGLQTVKATYMISALHMKYRTPRRERTRGAFWVLSRALCVRAPPSAGTSTT